MYANRIPVFFGWQARTLIFKMRRRHAGKASISKNSVRARGSNTLQYVRLYGRTAGC